MDDNRALSIVHKRLQPGETLIWYGSPEPAIAARGPLFVLAFLTLWVAFAYGWTALAAGLPQIAGNKQVSHPPPLLFLPFGLLFCALGTVFWLQALKSVTDCWRTAYGLTNRRIIIAMGDAGPTKSFGAQSVGTLLRTGDDLRGSIMFDFGPRGRRSHSGYREGLFGICNPARVEALIFQTLLNQKADTESETV
ncbi:MAG: hypothetical protein ACLPWS_05480 [Rhodomicrobium sp.]